MDTIDEILKRVWGYDEFRPLQRDAIGRVLAGRDSVVVLPTGGGKSLCYQVPALARDGMALVVSPLISLMKDQVDALRANGVEAAAIHSMLTPDERRDTANAIAAGRLKILYVSPERLATRDFVEYLKKSKIPFVAIDEAHCISHWGHDFRPEYRQLRDLKQHFPGISVHAYTATATQRVRDDISAQLGLDTPEIIVGSFDRPNLTYRVERRSDEFAQIKELVDRHPGESGIVYCISRRKVDDIAAHLKAEGIKALPYHAGMEDHDRRRNQDAFIREDVGVVVATVAFGMGIDKSNVRYVAHIGMPKSLEHYQQECGRAGRDGLEAECRLFHSGSDFMLWKRMLDGEPGEGADIAIAKLNDMQRFATSASCRRRAVLEYFGESYEEPNCGACDICLGEADEVSNAMEIAQKILSCVARLGSMAGPAYTTKVLRGAKEQRILDRGHDKLSTWGLLSEFAEKQIREWVEQLIGQGCADKVGEYGILHLTEKGREVLNGDETPRLLNPDTGGGAKRSKTDRASWEGVDRGLFEELRRARKTIANERDVPAFVIFTDASLRDMARRRPTTLDGFLRVTGVGRKKCDDLGETFIGEIRAYCDTSGVETDIDAPQPTQERTPRPANPVVRKRPNRTTQAAFDLFAMGNSVQEVAEQLARVESTVYGYLERYIEDRGLTDPNPWVDSELFDRVRDAVTAVGPGPLRPIFLHLNEEVPYEQIRIAVACMRNEDSV